MLPSHFLKIHLNIFHQFMPGSSKWSFSSGFPTRTLYAPLLFPVRATCPAHLILLDLIIRIKFDDGHRSLISSLCSFFALSYYHVPLRPKYSPQHPILKHPQHTFLPQCQRPSFIPIQNKRQNKTSVYLNLHILG